jgi:hypothetical protein
LYFKEEITAVESESAECADSSLGALLDYQRGKRSCDETSKFRASSGRGGVSFQIRTLVNGFNSGRTYHLHSNSVDECDEVVGNLRMLVEIAVKRAYKESKFRESQKWLRTIYESNIFQFFSSFLIVLVKLSFTPPKQILSS